MSFRLLPVCLTVLLWLNGGRLGGQTITDFNPKVGTTNDTIGVVGSGFSVGTIKIRFWPGVLSSSVVVNDDAHLQARVPVGAMTGALSVQRNAGTTNFSSQSFTVISHAPYITGFSTNLASAGDEIAIFGVHFTNASSVKFNGTNAPIFNVALSDGTQINVFIPNGATSGSVTVTTPLFGTGTSSVPFTVAGPGPYVTSFSPQGGPGGSQFMIFGVHFLPVNSVKVNGTNVAFFFVNAESVITASNRNDVSTGFITVSSPQGSFTTSSYFFVPPVFTAFSPTNGVAGTVVTITGQNFLGTTNVQLNGVDAAFTPPTTNSVLQFTVPGSVSSGQIRVATPGAVQFSGITFRMLPTLTGFSPTLGRPGTNVTITGANLNEGLASVKFNGATATFNNIQFGQVTATVPPTATTGPITITTTNGSVTTLSNFFLPASITGFTPNNSAPGTTVTITGQNFLGASAVSFNGTPASFIPPTTNTILLATVPDWFASGPISVTTPTGTTNSGNLLFYGRPVITGFTPTNGLPGTNVTISGSNFLGATAVTFNGVAASFTPPITNTTLLARVPTNNVFTGPIMITAPAGIATSPTPFHLDFKSDLVLAVTALPEPVFIGSNLTYTIVVSNAGPNDAPGVLLTNTLPASVHLKSASTTAGSLNTNITPIVGTLGTMNGASSATILLVVVPQSAGTIFNTASVGSLYEDPALANNSSTVATTVSPLPLLTIQIYAPGLVQISWPAALTNFVLQNNGVLTATNGWSDVGTTPLLIGDQKVIIDPIGSTPKFYRLKK
jgi:uncharacterized repeat protein (TIGR01451 family)